MRKIKKFWLIFLIFISLIPLFDLFRFGLPLTHDGQDHVARIANFYQSLSEGNIIPRWAANLNWGFGHPVLMFLYPLPSYIASFFHFLNLSLVDSTKIIFGLGFVLSGIFMYLWIRELWGEEAGFVSGLFYMFAPYRFVNLYVRGAIGENLAFVWLPLVCYFAFKSSRKFKWRYVVGGSLSLAALILSHNALSLMFLPLIFGYIGYLIYCSKRKLLSTVYYLLSTIFGLLLSAFFWFPAFFEGKYTLRDIVTKNNITGFESFFRLIWSPWSYGGTGSLSVQVGIMQWLGIVSAPFLIWLFWRKKDKIWLYLLFLFFCFWLAIFLILPGSKTFYLAIPILQKFQFVWRFLSLAIFPPAIFIGALIYLLPRRFKLFTVYCLLFTVLLLNKDYWQAKGFSYKDESFYSGVYASTTDTGESSPRWSVRFMEKFPKAPVEIIEGKAQIDNFWRKTTRQEFTVKAFTPSRIIVNTLYFPGWQVLVDGYPVEIQFQDPSWRGLMTFNVSAGEHQVVVKFGETRLRMFADVISLVGFVVLGVGSIISLRRHGKA